MGFFNLKQYSKLVNLIYGEKFYKFQGQIINVEIGKEALIVGPGNGGIISHLDLNKRYCLLEKSKTFCKQLKHLTKDKKEFWVMNADFFSWKPNEKFDIVMFPFFLDLFTKQEQIIILEKSYKLLHKGGKILIIDFEPPHSFLEKLHIKLLYLVFRRFDGITGDKLISQKSLNTKVIGPVDGLKSPFYQIKAYKVLPPKP